MSTQHMILLDRTGSMNSKWDETIGALNAYIENLPKKDKITIAAFDNQGYDTLRDEVKVKNFNKMAIDEVSPRGMTPLFDSIGKAANTLLTKNSDRAILLVLTDGQENCSREYDKKETKVLVDKLKDKNYEVIFLGADFDTMDDRQTLGVANNKAVNLNRGFYASGMRELAVQSTAYSTTGASINTDQS